MSGAEAEAARSIADRMPDLTIGLFGPRRVVRLMLDSAHQLSERPGAQRIKFLSGIHDHPQQAEDRYRQLAPRIDAAVFAGPWLYDLARSGGWLTGPATHIPLTGAALYAALLRATLTMPEVDLTRVTIDSLSAQDVDEAYDEIGLDSSAVHCQAYLGPDSVAGYVDFHRAAYQAERSTLALTTILSVDRALRSRSVPALRIVPTHASIRDALQTATLLGQGTRLGENQIAMVAVHLVPTRSVGGAGDYWQQELALSAHQQLLAAARGAGATVTRHTDRLFLTTMTYGALTRATDQLQVAPFAADLGRRLGVPVAVGVGLGHTARAAEVNALTAVEGSLDSGGEVAIYLGAAGERSELPVRSPRPTARSEPGERGGTSQTRAAEIAGQLIAAVPATGDDRLVADVETVAEVMSVTQRTGRRMLKELVDAGLAWPLPPVRSVSGGRPRQQFRLLTEKLE
ncbi:hypothetical protein [Microlunatus soli]|uniref:Transcriptional regulator n=1 Tax=Microlunatus soli TaxID=630515 RepID=A0A1H1R7Z1_9ACTN|nr:hypothetical protein [Microlunatus soli]SDS31831.1 hypothetical protein SAMN04489812_1546 [Microlunatus soli]